MKYTMVLKITAISFIFCSCAQVEHTEIVHDDIFVEQQKDFPSQEKIKFSRKNYLKIEKVKLGMKRDHVVNILGHDFEYYARKSSPDGILSFMKYSYCNTPGKPEFLVIFFDRNGVAKKILKRDSEYYPDLIIKTMKHN